MVYICKILGAVFVLGAAGYMSVNINQSMELRKQELRRLYGVLLQLKSEIQYMANTLPESFRHLSDGVQDPLKKWLISMSERMEEKNSTCFRDIWIEELQHLYQNSSMEWKDIEPLQELADKLGNVDTLSQIKAIDYAILHIERSRTELEEEISQKKKVVTTISMFGGFMILILLL